MEDAGYENEMRCDMKNQNLQKQYIDKVNGYLSQVDFAKLDRSCNSADDSYAKEVLKALHDLFVEVYGVDYLDTGYEFVDMPAVILGCETGHIGLGLVSLYIPDSGEHYGTSFFTPLGVLDDGDEELTAADRKYLRDNYGPYDYWYTIELERDYHVDFESIPAKVEDLLNHCPLDRPEIKLE